MMKLENIVKNMNLEHTPELVRHGADEIIWREDRGVAAGDGAEVAGGGGVWGQGPAVGVQTGPAEQVITCQPHTLLPGQRTCYVMLDKSVYILQICFLQFCFL